jgi:hypothetical protein
LVESNQRRSDGQPLLTGVAHGLANGHHHLAGLRLVHFAIVLQETAH